jgi:hypothetical protein
MSHYRALRLSLVVAAIVVSAVPSVFAQPLGTFRWQFAPYCNVVTLYAVQQPNDVITLSGTDDQCGGTSIAAAVGTAHLNPSGTVGISVVVTRPDGIALSSTGEVSLVTGVGPWKDDAGNSGTLEISPPSPATGTPRRITLKGVYSDGFNAAGAGIFQVSQLSFGRTLPAAPSVPAANIIPFDGSPTANCPGSFANPQAVPGQLCLYERSRENATYRVSDSAGALDVGDTIGAHVYVVSQAAGPVAIAGAWAVTIP